MGNLNIKKKILRVLKFTYGNSLRAIMICISQKLTYKA